MAADESHDDKTQSFIALTSGTDVLHYRILEKIGSGGMGEVYLALDTKLNRRVALKFLLHHLCQDENCRKRFKREAQAAAKLSHPNIVTIHEVGEHQNRPYFVMEHVKGQSLKNVIRSNDLSLDRIVDMVIQTCEGLSKAHQSDIVHRDVKPSNIAIDADGRPKLLDFGLAAIRNTDHLTKTGSTLGTVGYMSPEQVQGKDTDHRSDLFSLGIVLYEMIACRLPFKGDTEAATMNSVINEVPEPLSRYKSGVSDKFQDIVSKLLEKDPSLRYQSAAGVISDLKRFAMDQLSDSKKDASQPSIAVLPFVDMSPEKDQEYFCDGIAEELINGLAQVGELKVAARTSAFQFKRPDRDISAVGRELGVTSVLEGSVRKAGNRLRITAQLVSVIDGFHLWSEKYDRTLDDVFAIQDEISLAIVEKLRLQLLEPEKKRLVRRHTDNKEAYNLYLKGRYYWNKRHEGGMTSALDYYQQAIDRDPTYPLPYIGIADAYAIFGVFGFLPPRESFPKAMAAAKKALDLDDSLGQARAPFALAAFFYEWDWVVAEREFDICIKQSPDYAIVHSWYATYLSGRGRFEDALAEAERALELDPMSLIFSSIVGLMYFEGRHYDHAMEQFRRTLEREPAFQPALLWLTYTHYGREDFEGALAVAEQLESLPGGEKYAAGMLGAIYARQGLVDEAESELQRLQVRAENEYVPSTRFVPMLWYLGRKDEAIKYLEKAYEERDGYLSRLTVTPFFGDDMCADSRIIDLAKRLGLDKKDSHGTT